MKAFTAETYKNITGYEAVRSAARDYLHYSSDLQGDRDVRDYKQLPLEVDPPNHTDYRHALQPVFLRPKLESHLPVFSQLASDLLEAILTSDRAVDVGEELAQKYVVGCLAIVYNRPQDLERWIGWGGDVWTAVSDNRSGQTLHEYLDQVWVEESEDDIWAIIKNLKPRGEALTKTEFFGYAGVLLAGGRDTVIQLITGLVWHLTNNRDDLAKLKADPSLDRAIVNELLRFLTPLPAIERVDRETFDAADPTYYRLHFASANHDPAVWEDPHLINIERGKQPNLAFGYGPHSCIGMNLAEFEARAFLQAFVTFADDLELTDFKVSNSEVDGIPYVSGLKAWIRTKFKNQ